MSEFKTKAVKLPNGVNVVTENRPGTGMVSIQIAIKAGGADEPADESGLTNLVQEASLTGTTTRTRDQIADDSETKGSSIGGGVDMERVVYKTKALTRNATGAFEVLADVVLNPTFDAGELEQVKGQIVQSLKQKSNNPSAIAGRKLFETMFPGQSYGADADGTPDLVASYTPGQLKKRHAELLSHPSDIVISFSGDIDPATAEKLAADWFGKLSGAKKPAATPAVFNAGDFRQDEPGPQANINLAFKAPGPEDPDRYALMMFSELFAGGMSGPLFQELRVKRGLVYTPGAQYLQMGGAGAYIISNGTGEGQSGELASSIINLLGKYAREGFTDEAKERALESMLRGIKDGRESSGSSASINAGQILKFGELQDVATIEARLRSVTNDDIRRVAANMLKDGDFVLSATGPLVTLQPEQELRDLAKSQVDGMVIPAPSKQPAPVTVAFNAAAKKAETFDGIPRLTVLPNGLKVFTIERDGPLSIGGWVGAGSDHETPELNGATHLNEHMMFRGTPTYGAGTIDKIVEGEMGGGLNAYTTKDKTAYYFYSLLPKHLAKSLDIIGEMIFEANIEEQELSGAMEKQPDGTFKKGKGEIEAVIKELNKGLASPGRALAYTYEGTAYKGTKHAQTTIGTEAVLRKVTAQMLRDYRDEFYAPNNVIMGAAGPIKHEDFVELVKAKYGHLKPTDFPPLENSAYQGGTGYVEHRSAQLATVLIGAEGTTAADPDNYPLTALSMILGGGSSSRLEKEVVLKQDLALGAGAGTSEYRNAGTFDMQIVTSPDKVKAATKAVYAELRRLVNDVTQEELDKVKASLELGIRSGGETNQDVANSFGVDLQAAGRPILMQEKLDMVAAMTLDDIRRMANKVLASNPTVAGVVPPGTDMKLMPTLEEAKAWRDGVEPPKAANTNKPKPPAKIA